MQAIKHYSTLPVAASEEDLADLDEARRKVPFQPSRSKFSLGCLRLCLRRIKQGELRPEDIGSELSMGPAGLAREEG